MSNIHIITLPEIQAIWFEEICKELGIIVIRQIQQVFTKCSNEEREIVWNLFVESFNKVIN